jgi:hypothetical protein
MFRAFPYAGVGGLSVAIYTTFFKPLIFARPIKNFIRL